MEWLIQLQGQVVGLDTAPLIYFIEQNESQPVNNPNAANGRKLLVLSLHPSAAADWER